jgi:hypothetical protein
MIVGLATSLSPIVAQSCFNVFNVRTEIKLILILIPSNPQPCIPGEVDGGFSVFMQPMAEVCIHMSVPNSPLALFFDYYTANFQVLPKPSPQTLSTLHSALYTLHPTKVNTRH